MTSPDLAFTGPATAPQPQAAAPPGRRGPKSADAATPEAPAKKGKKKQLMILAVVLLLAVGYVAQGKLLATHYKPGQPVPLGTIDTMTQLTVNLSDGHMAQATIALQLTTVANQKTVTADMPRFADAAITVLGAQTYPSLLTNAGRNEVKAQLLQRCQHIVGTVDGAAQQIVAIYFTGFVVQ